jgi:adenine-specific DNA-methyltransferase
MTDTNPAKCKKLATFLKELFQLDQPDLDFGIYGAPATFSASTR